MAAHGVGVKSSGSGALIQTRVGSIPPVAQCTFYDRGAAKLCLYLAPTWLRLQSARCLKPRHGRGPAQLPSSSRVRCTSTDNGGRGEVRREIGSRKVFVSPRIYRRSSGRLETGVGSGRRIAGWTRLRNFFLLNGNTTEGWTSG
jgi:hypothetical protein